MDCPLIGHNHIFMIKSTNFQANQLMKQVTGCLTKWKNRKPTILIELFSMDKHLELSTKLIKQGEELVETNYKIEDCKADQF